MLAIVPVDPAEAVAGGGGGGAVDSVNGQVGVVVLDATDVGADAAGAAAAVDADLTTHEAETTNVHGIADTAVLLTSSIYGDPHTWADEQSFAERVALLDLGADPAAEAGSTLLYSKAGQAYLREAGGTIVGPLGAGGGAVSPLVLTANNATETPLTLVGDPAQTDPWWAASIGGEAAPRVRLEPNDTYGFGDPGSRIVFGDGVDDKVALTHDGSGTVYLGPPTLGSGRFSIVNNDPNSYTSAVTVFALASSADMEVKVPSAGGMQLGVISDKNNPVTNYYGGLNAYLRWLDNDSSRGFSVGAKTADTWEVDRWTAYNASVRRLLVNGVGPITLYPPDASTPILDLDGTAGQTGAWLRGFVGAEAAPRVVLEPWESYGSASDPSFRLAHAKSVLEHDGYGDWFLSGLPAAGTHVTSLVVSNPTSPTDPYSSVNAVYIVSADSSYFSPGSYVDIYGPAGEVVGIRVLAAGPQLTINNMQVIGARGAAVADASGGTVVDVEARAAINSLLARFRASTGHGAIAG